MSHGSHRELAVSGLARVEGQGSLRLAVRDGVVTDATLDIFEPPRFFEALLQGRHLEEAPDITSRICGICPVAYQLTAAAAIESACEVRVDDTVRQLRRLLYCGEWIQSHALHIVLLHAPDFAGCADAVELAERDPEAVRRGVRIKQAGNQLLRIVGGRTIHPVNVRVGGFWSAPTPEAVAALRAPLQRALDDAVDLVRWVAGFDVPDIEVSHRLVSLRGDGGYPVETGRVWSPGLLDTDAAGLAERIVEQHVAHSTALQARIDGQHTYLTGPLARYAHNHDLLSPVARQVAAEADLGDQCRNPFRSIVVRAVELVFACEEALRLVASYSPPPPAVPVPARAATGAAVTEAPRGLLLHRYEIGPDGLLRSARIVAPTSQNQLAIEEDVRHVAEQGLALGDAELTRRCERAIRNHDPCISCAAHFLDLHMEPDR